MYNLNPAHSFYTGRNMKYTVQPLLTGTFTVSFKTDEHIKFPKVNDIPSYIFLVTAESGEHIIVDTGFDLQHIPGNNSRGSKTPSQEIPELLMSRGVDPLKVTKLIQTHLHWDHAAGIKYFPNAEIFVQAAEISGLFSLVKYEETSFAPLHWLHALERFTLVNGDLEIMPGLKLLQTGGHTTGHQGVKLDGKNGTIVLIGDSPFTYEWLWTLVPESSWSMYRSGEGKNFFWQEQYLDIIKQWYARKMPAEQLHNLYRSVNDLRSMGDIVLFSHETSLNGTELF